MSPGNPIKVILDARKLGDGGIGVYIANLVSGLLELGGTRLSLVVPKHWVERSSGHLHQGPLPDVSECLARWADRVTYLPESSGKYSLSEYLVMPWRQQRAIRSAQIFHSPHYTLPYFLHTIAPELRHVVTVHDVIHVSHPDSPIHRTVGRALIGSALRRADAVITVSEHSREEIKRYFGARLARKCTVIANAIQPRLKNFSGEELLAQLSKWNLQPGTYLLYVGGDRPHKGFGMLKETWRKFREARLQMGRAEMPSKCVAVGSFSQTGAGTIVDREWLLLRGLTMNELSALYSGARAVVLPSRAEGFGLVALEALSTGIPLVTTPLPSVREICGDAAYVSEGFDADSFTAALKQALSDPEGAAVVRRGLDRAKPFSLRAASEKTLRLYERLVGSASLPAERFTEEQERERQRAKLVGY